MPGRRVRYNAGFRCTQGSVVCVWGTTAPLLGIHRVVLNQRSANPGTDIGRSEANARPHILEQHTQRLRESR